ncbi:hypothetical protein QQF64_036332 [Cirrhinus molitorella]|uniref:FISNA domain-containing protein n=1 Tax=Cirrhinus molitorella TaxID=172907 RepID=A0ABR3NIH5_9TELE
MFNSGDSQTGLSPVQQKTLEPVSSCVSMKSDVSMEPPVMFNRGDSQTGLSPVQQKTLEPVSSCVSMKSDVSMEPPVMFNRGDSQTGLSPVQQKTSEPESSCVTMKSEESMVCQEQFKSGDTWPGLSSEVLNTFRSNLKKKFGHLHEGTVMQGNPTLLNEIYTELYITERKHILLADTLSRTYCRGQERGSVESEIDSINMVTYLPLSKERTQAIQRATELDTELQSLKKVILQGWPEGKEHLSMDVT